MARSRLTVDLVVRDSVSRPGSLGALVGVKGLDEPGVALTGRVGELAEGVITEWRHAHVDAEFGIAEPTDDMVALKAFDGMSQAALPPERLVVARAESDLASKFERRAP